LKEEAGLAAVLFGPSFDFAQDDLWSVLLIKQLQRWRDGTRASITPRGGVWRKFSEEIIQALDASADFVSGGGGYCCTRRT